MKTHLMRLSFIVLSLLLVFTTAHAQTAEDSVKATVNKLFAAMKNADAKSLQECFADSAILQTILDKNGRSFIETEAVQGFAASIGKVSKGDADERITFDIVRVDDDLAIVWAPYQFYWKGSFSHCGADSFQLVRINAEWKIQYLIDTRRKTGCK